MRTVITPSNTANGSWVGANTPRNLTIDVNTPVSDGYAIEKIGEYLN